MFERVDHMEIPTGFADQEQEAFFHELKSNPAKLHKHIEKLKREMLKAAADLEFETAAELRDEIKKPEEMDLGLA